MLQEKNILKYCITYTTVSCFFFFFLFTLVDLLNYSTMTFINYTCIYIDLYVFACAHHGLTFFFVWQTRLWILQMVCGALITCNNLIFVPCDCSGSVFANLLLPIMLLNINGCQRFLALFYAVFPIMEGIKLSRKCLHAFVISCACFFYYIENSKHQVILCYVNLKLSPF